MGAHQQDLAANWGWFELPPFLVSHGMIGMVSCSSLLFQRIVPCDKYFRDGLKAKKGNIWANA